jgi:transcriptional/translational regulatory protein YebC/TACO1
VAEVRHVFNKHGGNLAEAGAVSWQFTRKGYISISEEVDEDEVFLVAADAGADDVRFDDEVTEVYAEIEQLQDVRQSLVEGGYKLDEVSVIYDPNNPLELETNQALQVLKVVELMEDLDDVQNVYSTLEISEAAMVALEAA